MRMIFMAAFMVLTACSSPAIYKPVEVDLPVAKPCTAPMPEAPDWPLTKQPPDTPLYQKTQNALAEIELRKSYETELQAALQSCR